MTTLLLTGASGLVGSRLLPRLAQSGFECRALVRADWRCRPARPRCAPTSTTRLAAGRGGRCRRGRPPRRPVPHRRRGRRLAREPRRHPQPDRRGHGPCAARAVRHGQHGQRLRRRCRSSRSRDRRLLPHRGLPGEQDRRRAAAARERPDLDHPAAALRLRRRRRTPRVPGGPRRAVRAAPGAHLLRRAPPRRRDRRAPRADRGHGRAHRQRDRRRPRHRLRDDARSPAPRSRPAPSLSSTRGRGAWTARSSGSSASGPPCRPSTPQLAKASSRPSAGKALRATFPGEQGRWTIPLVGASSGRGRRSAPRRVSGCGRDSTAG